MASRSTRISPDEADAVVFTPATSAHCSDIARIHAHELSDGFLPQFGERFLFHLYRAMFASQAARGVVAQIDGQVVGFSCYTTEHATFFRRTLRHASPGLFVEVAKALCRRPRLLKGIVETLRYAKAADVPGVAAEIYAVALDRRWHARHIGLRIFDHTEALLRSEGIRAWKHTVYDDNHVALELYRRRGHVRTGSFRLYGRSWSVFRVDLGEAPSSA